MTEDEVRILTESDDVIRLKRARDSSDGEAVAERSEAKWSNEAERRNHG